MPRISSINSFIHSTAASDHTAPRAGKRGVVIPGQVSKSAVVIPSEGACKLLAR